MIAEKLRVIEFPHPTLRHKSKPLRRVDAVLLDYIRQMFECMYESKGIGLAANQVDLPYRMFVVNPSGDPQLKEQEQVFINPVITAFGGTAEREEGCLSLPGLYGDVKRPDEVSLEAYSLKGDLIRLETKGLLARIIQHENDHLDGVLFVDRLSLTQKLAIKEDLELFESKFRRQRERGEIRDDVAIMARIEELERERT